MAKGFKRDASEISGGRDDWYIQDNGTTELARSARSEFVKISKPVTESTFVEWFREFQHDADKYVNQNEELVAEVKALKAEHEEILNTLAAANQELVKVSRPSSSSSSSLLNLLPTRRKVLLYQQEQKRIDENDWKAFTRTCILAVRETPQKHVSPFIRNSQYVSFRIPSREAGVERLKGLGIREKETVHSRMTKVKLENNQQIRTIFPDFPLIVKKCRCDGPFPATRLIREIRYAFTDAIVTGADVKISKNEFSIRFKSRIANANDAEVENDDSGEIISDEEWFQKFVLKENVIQHYRMFTRSDIPGHTPLCRC